jgi:hypothetical protein
MSLIFNPSVPKSMSIITYFLLMVIVFSFEIFFYGCKIQARSNELLVLI